MNSEQIIALLCGTFVGVLLTVAFRWILSVSIDKLTERQAKQWFDESSRKHRKQKHITDNAA